MKNITKLAALAVATASAAATPAFAAPVDSTTGSAKVKIVRGLTLTNTGEIEFGTIVLPASPTTGSATLTVAPDGTFSGCTVDFTCSITNGGASTAEDYSLSGTRAVNVIVTIPKTATIYVDGVTTNPSLDVTLASDIASTSTSDTGSAIEHTVTLPNSGAAGSAANLDFSVGGSITISETTTDGAYSGSFTVSADYE